MSESLFVTSLILTLFILVFFLYAHSKKLPDFAKFLPSEDTSAFLTFSMTDYNSSPVKITDADLLQIYFGTSADKLDFLADAAGLAYVKESPLVFFEISSQKKAMNFLKTLAIEGEQITEENGIHTYTQSHPFSFVFVDDMLAFSTNVEALAAIASTENEKIKNTDEYSNLRSRLPYFSSAFFYVNLAKSRAQIAQAFAKIGINEPGYMEAVFQLFPTFGGTLEIQEDGFFVQTFTAADKSRIGGEALFRYETKYEQKFLPLLPDEYLFEWGGHNTKAQVFRMLDLLKNIHSSAALVFESAIRANVEKYFGKGINLDTEVYPLLDGEYLYAWNPVTPNSFMFMLELDEEESTTAYRLRDLFVNKYQYKREFQREVELPDGAKVTETAAELIPVSQIESKYDDHSFVVWKAGDKEIGAIAILDSMAIVADSQNNLKKVLDILDKKTEPRSLRDFGQLLSGSDEISVLHTDKIPEGNVLKKLFEGFKSFSTSRRVFDDGIFTRHSFLYK